MACVIPIIVNFIRSLTEREVSKSAWTTSTIVAIGGIFLLSVGLWLIDVYTDVLFFENLGYQSVFWKTNLLKWGFFWGAWIGFIILFMLNYRIIKKSFKLFGPLKVVVPLKEKVISNPRSFRRLSDDIEDYERSARSRYEEERVKSLKRNSLIVEISAWTYATLFGVIMAAFMVGGWEKALLWANQTPMGVIDPIFGKDISFYLFSMPFQQYLSGWIFWVLVLFLIGTICIYWVYTSFTDERSKDDIKDKIWGACKSHSAFFVFCIAIVWVWERVLGMYQLLYSTGTVYGAGNTDVSVRIGANWAMIVAICLFALVLFIRIFVKKDGLLFLGVPIVLIWIIGVGIVPACYQQFSVKPNELEKEQTYLNYNIDSTRQAFGLDKMDEKEMDISENITKQQLSDNQLILGNIRSWDWRVLVSNYQQKQLFRQYYQFNDIDIDRYKVNGDYRQVMLASREMDQSKLDPKALTWVNEHIKYTHGYGLALNAVNEATESGMPIYLVKDIPPVSTISEIKVARPEIYFGELTINHVYTNTKEPEFDYPQGDQNAYCFYEGSGGVKLDSWFKKLAFALKYDGMTLFLSDYITPESRILYYRQVNERIQKIAPFLLYDADPYMVVDSNGKLWLMLDAFTTSNYYPYSEPYDGAPFNKEINYIRNSVKVVVDPYNGFVDFYIVDETDPIIRAYQGIFPALFKSKDQMPKDLVSHLRYPEDLIYVQAKVYCTYHMTDPGVFYNKEDLWEIGKEIHGKDPLEMIPYFVIASLPGGEDEEFIQMLPFTPKDKENLIGWMAGRCDGEEYGQGLVFKFSKQTLVYGPMQFAARTNQNDEIAKTLALWTQAGSDVIRGNTLIIPIADTLMYFQPVYLKAQESEMPELKKVIVAIGDRIDWGDNLEDALGKILGFSSKSTVQTAPVVVGEDISGSLKSIQGHFDEYQRLTGEGKLVEAGQELEQLRTEIDRLLGQ